MQLTVPDSPEASPPPPPPTSPVTLRDFLPTLSKSYTPRDTPQVLQAVQSQLRGPLLRTLTSQTSTSLTLVGPPCSGKSLLLRLTLNDLKNDPKASNFQTITLNGMIHSDPSTLFYALNTVLGSSNNDPNPRNMGWNKSFELLNVILQHSTSQPLIIILENLHLFTQHSKTLLYHLTDLLQSPNHRFSLVGLTSVLSYFELFERRVRSRIQGGVIYTRALTLEEVKTILISKLGYYKGTPESYAELLNDDGSIVAEMIKRQWNVSGGLRSFFEVLHAWACIVESRGKDGDDVNCWVEAFGVCGAEVQGWGVKTHSPLAGLNLPSALIVASLRRLTARQTLTTEQCCTYKEISKDLKSITKVDAAVIKRCLLALIDRGVVQVARFHLGGGAMRYNSVKADLAESENLHLVVGREDVEKWCREFRGWGTREREWATKVV
ncbi:hypothetical protein TrST_g11452 [Triparma strigata]|uniref:ORC1/DEAH AAA+ ATPase domain-containing protein n=1 Tax=Triparma strigata TaxID=1606541 RepID=A0A9W7A8N8_9STRA|nr:hypothetical protein TrST_g11452 [Triparma strigata]